MIMRKISPHQSIINLLEVYTGDDNIYLVIDLAEGGSLYSEMKKRKRLYEKKEV